MNTTLTDRVLADRYRVGEVLGRGGMADVYDATDTRLGRSVAVKVLNPAMAVRPDVRRRFEEEARSAARLSHPNLVSVFDTGQEGDDGTPWIVMERLSGETLADRMAAGPLDADFVVRVAGDVLGALGAAHKAGILHRDVKPGNILFGDDGCAKVADFGIAKSVEAVGNDATTAGMLLGTPRYLAPERIDGEPATPSSDLYALGVVLYEALSGRKAFQGDTPVTTAYSVQHDTPEPLTSLRPGLTPALTDVIERAMSRDPHRRFHSAEEMQAALAPASPNLAAGLGPDHDPEATAVLPLAGLPLAGLPLAGPALDGLAERARRVDRSTLVLGAAFAAFVLLLLGLALTRPSKAKPAVATAPTTTTAAPTTTSTTVANPLADQLSALASRLRGEERDNNADGEAADRLQQVAEQLRSGADAGPTASALYADVVAWARDGELAMDDARAALTLLGQVPGVDKPAGAEAGFRNQGKRGKGGKGGGD
ncbi:MAG TPA: protein kinase [Acidimicrobiales bacterium]|nr:protein kinase [Acidimicrobiales bacterium]